jgi:hypothetical protein
MLEIADELRKIADRLEMKGEITLYAKSDYDGDTMFSNETKRMQEGCDCIDSQIKTGLTLSKDKWTKVKLVEVAE